MEPLELLGRDRRASALPAARGTDAALDLGRLVGRCGFGLGGPPGIIFLSLLSHFSHGL
jgi:hypothetical protein